MSILERIIIIAFSCLFIHATTLEGMINEWARRLTFHWPSWLKKIIYDCPICMVPWWGTLLILTGLIPYSSLQEAILVVMAAGGLNTLLAYLIGDDGPPSDQIEADD